MPQPTVSIITATYNRSNVLAFALRSALASTWKDWELIVVGDACTDDSQKVVESLGEPRIRFTNLPRNTGDQSEPNNQGVRLSTGRYIAYLNHDDLWFPDHLDTAVNALETSEADLVFTLGLALRPGNEQKLSGIPADGLNYEPNIFVPATVWVFRRELAKAVGPWLHYRKCYNLPSQNWLFRAYRMGKKLQLVPQITALLIQGGLRKDVYARREETENKAYFIRMTHDPGFREELTRQMMMQFAAQNQEGRFSKNPVRALRRAANRCLFPLGLNATILKNMVRYHKRGGLVDHLRRHTGARKTG
ncbi:MAG TPA: glycosyltransferase family A protein [Candidatus Hydrogenedentes bacterium]|nr:glycosyltransferase family A protein [Candidatus Hydrogenedentota bacterium]